MTPEEIKTTVVKLIDALVPTVGSSNKTASIKFNLDDTHTDTESEQENHYWKFC